MIVKLEGGKVVPKWPVPFQFPLVDQDAHRQGGERFGGRADGKERFRRDLEVLLRVTPTEPLREDDFTVLYNGDRQPRHFPVFHRLDDKIVETA